ncbi:hypothetical protein CCYA_CCYA18G4452 [Cyanidiococcus yangmingshanensis]|nr:hypothetical protein CCYA_CCYA18G4452 [Cyanidiococcus yangmingshanensis]
MLSTRLFWICVAILLGVAFIGAPVTGSECNYYCNSDTRSVSATIDTDCERGCTPSALCNGWNSFYSICVSSRTEAYYQWFAGVLYKEKSINSESCPPTLEFHLVGLSIPAGTLGIKSCSVDHDVKAELKSYSVTLDYETISSDRAIVAEVTGSCMNGAVVMPLVTGLFQYFGTMSASTDVIYHDKETGSVCAYTLKES